MGETISKEHTAKSIPVKCLLAMRGYRTESQSIAADTTHHRRGIPCHVVIFHEIMDCTHDVSA
jgi:hypothetical protein